MDTGYSLSDIAAASGNEGLGGNTWLILLFILIFGMGGFGRNNDSFGQYATAASQNELLLGQKFDALGQKVNQIGDGLCSSTYALNNAIIGEGRTLGTAVANGFSNLQSCCCDLKYDMAQNFAATNANTTAATQKILDALAQNKIDALQAEVNTLKTQNMFCGVPRINPYGYGVYQYNNGCNCGNV